MSAVTRPRGPLPRRVYWVRRVLVLVVLAVVVALVWGFARLLGGSGGEPGGAASAVVAGREPSPSGTETPQPRKSRGGAVTERSEGSERGGQKRKRQKEPRLAEPSGPCEDSDVVVTPEVTEPYVGAPIELALQLTTRKSKACLWEVSPESVFLVISDDKGPLWSSQDCPGAIPTEQVVPRREDAAVVTVRWNGRQSDAECSGATPWVWPGEYTATAVARGSVTPVDTAFELLKQPPDESTESPSPDREPGEQPADEPRDDGR